MKFDLLVNNLLEGFNQTAPSTGPDIGMTSGDQQNTFPSKMETVTLRLPKKKKIKKIRKG
jgi:hypothetical protein